MVDHKIVRSTEKPEAMKIDDFSVWVASDIHPVTETVMDQEFKGFEYHLIQYTKDEFIQMSAEKNARLEADVTNTQVALCDVYEAMAANTGV